MEPLSYIIISTVIVSIISFCGAIILFTRKNIENILFLFVAFAAGAMLAVAFFDLVPESLHHFEESKETIIFSNPYIMILLGIVAFFVLEQFIHWHHYHHVDEHTKTKKKKKKAFTYMNLIGDGLHNFLDGVIIAVAYLVNIPLGMVTTIAVIFHEIPQEIGDVSILLYGGFTPKKALMWNLASALTAVLGSIITYFYAKTVEGIVPLLLAFAAGGFIYIATADLIPEMHRETKQGKALFQLIAFIAGIAILYWLGIQFGHTH